MIGEVKLVMSEKGVSVDADLPKKLPKEISLTMMHALASALDLNLLDCMVFVLMEQDMKQKGGYSNENRCERNKNLQSM